MERFEKSLKWSDVRVGLLAFAAIVCLVAGIMFAGGDKGLLFKKTSTVSARLTDVGSLKKGSSVTMGGMTVGKVTEIAFVNDVQSKLIEVSMEVRQDVRPRIKTDSIPTVRTQGMLGDRYIEISMGSDKAIVLPEGQPLTGEPATDFDKAISQANAVLKESNTLLVALNEQRGTAGRLVYDEKLYERITAIAEEIQSLVQDFKKNPRRYLKFSVF